MRELPGFQTLGAVALLAAALGCGDGSGAPNAGIPNEPAGYVPFAINGYSSIPTGDAAPGEPAGELGRWFASPQGNPNLTIESDGSAPESPSTVVQTRFRSTLPAGSSPVITGGWDESGEQKSKVYFSMWIKIVGPDYENHPTLTKMGFFAYAEATTAANNEGFFTLEGTGQRVITSSFTVAFRQQNNVNRNLFPNVDTSPLMTCGTWHQWEAVLELNSAPGVADGTFQMWIDGTQTHDYSNMVYTTPGDTNKFFLWKWVPVWGGQGSSRTRDDSMQIDNVYLSGLP